PPPLLVVVVLPPPLAVDLDTLPPLFDVATVCPPDSVVEEYDLNGNNLKFSNARRTDKVSGGKYTYNVKPCDWSTLSVLPSCQVCSIPISSRITSLPVLFISCKPNRLVEYSPSLNLTTSFLSLIVKRLPLITNVPSSSLISNFSPRITFPINLSATTP